jgi:hypothetical protein
LEEQMKIRRIVWYLCGALLIGFAQGACDSGTVVHPPVDPSRVGAPVGKTDTVTVPGVITSNPSINKPDIATAKQLDTSSVEVTCRRTGNATLTFEWTQEINGDVVEHESDYPVECTHNQGGGG